MDRVVISTSVFEPVELEIAGKVYQTIPLSKKAFRRLDKFDKEADIKDPVTLIDALVNQVAFLCQVPPEEFEDTDVRILKKVLGSITDRVTQPPSTPEATAEKNVPKPGDAPLP